PRVRVIDGEGEQLGILETRKAIELAAEQGYDLVEVSPNVDPPVCRMMDFGKHKYQQSKKTQKKVHHTVHTKEIKLRPFTGEHDFGVKMRHVIEFLEKGNKVKITVVFRGRELQFKKQGEVMLEKVTGTIGEHGVVEKNATMEGRSMIMMVSPKKTV
ncbi:MAG: translation initiation factor IF-3, partial [Proteobacteria bacterium]|nr:translation initiation factor IF-3 [Pseudomonadota bacterium]